MCVWRGKSLNPHVEKNHSTYTSYPNPFKLLEPTFLKGKVTWLAPFPFSNALPCGPFKKEIPDCATSWNKDGKAGMLITVIR